MKALNILVCLGEGDRPSYTLTELSRLLHLHVSTVHRLLVNLVRQGFVEPGPSGGGYQIGSRVLRMGLKMLDRMDFRRVAQPLLRELNQKTQETVFIAILEGVQAVYVDTFGSPQPVGMGARLDRTVPLHCTAAGKALLAYQGEEMLERLTRSPGLERRTPNTITTLPQLKNELAQIRVQGYAVDNEESVDGLRCIAAPLFDHQGRVVAAFSVAGPATRITPARVPQIGSLVLESSRQISYRLGFNPHSRSS